MYLEDDDFYDAEQRIEKVREVKQLANRIQALKAEIEQMNEKQGESELDQVKKVLNNINMFFDGTKNSASGKVLNEILNEFVHEIRYKRNGRGAEVQVKVYLKDWVQEIINHKEDLSKIA